MFFYITLAFVITFLFWIGYWYPSKSDFIQWVVFFILVCVAGFRHHVGIDYDMYIDWFVNKSRDDRLEFGFVALMNLFRNGNISYIVLFSLFSFFTILLAFIAIKKFTINSSTAFLFFFLVPELYLCSFNLIRQSFAVSICFFAFYFLIQKKYFIFLFLSFLSISIHNSAILAILVFLLVFKYGELIKAKHIIILLISSFTLSHFNFIEIFDFLFKNTRYTYYFDGPRIHVTILKTIVLNSIALFVLYYFETLKKQYIYQKYFMLLYFCTVIFMNLFSTFGNIERLTYYFKIFEIIVVADIIYLKHKENGYWIFSFFYLYYLSYFIHTLNNDYVIKSSSKLIPYQTFAF